MTQEPEAQRASALTISGLVKRYGSLAAVNGVSLEVRVGEVFGLLGPNGAGKTTTLEIAVGMRRPTSGSVSVLGLDPWRDRPDLLQRVAIQPQGASLFPRATVAEVLELWSSFYERPRPVPEVVRMLGLEEQLKTQVKRLSGGQRQRLLLACVVVADAQVLLLDEPTAGLDPHARQGLWAAIRAYRDSGRTIILTTHSMDEAEALCDRVGIMHEGRLVALDTPAALCRAHFPDQSVVFETDEAVDEAELARLLPGTEASVRQAGTRYAVRLTTREPEEALRRVLDSRHRFHAYNLRLEQGSLEEVFLTLTGASIDADGNVEPKR